MDGRPVRAYPRGGELEAECGERYVDAAWKVVRRVSPEEPGTDPALVAVTGRLPASLYWRAVREVVPVRSVERTLRATGARIHVRAARRGLVGAASAIAWPARHGTWELITYRQPERLGRPRVVDAASVVDVQRTWSDLFLCHDPATRRLLVTPHTDCPVLFGLRGTSRGAPIAARRLIRSEPVERWMLFRTNQATGDHLVPRTTEDLLAYRSAIVAGTVDGPVETLRGGHVRFDLRATTGGIIPCVAFEPTKTLPAVARALVPGDRLRIWGSRGAPATVHLEGIEVVGLVPRGRWEGPWCTACGRRSRSLGTHKGWRCDRCRRRFPPEAAYWSARAPPIAPGAYHPTPSARRHLAPLAR